MKFLEKDLEEIIFDNPTKIEAKGLKIFSIPKSIGYREIFQQVHLGSYGIADLIVVEYVKLSGGPIEEAHIRRRIVITIVECKLNMIDTNAYMQVKRYETAVNRILEDHDLSSSLVQVKTVLIGKEVNLNGDFIYAYCNDQNCSFYTYDFDLEGMSFSLVDKSWFKPGNESSKVKTASEFLRFFQEAYYHKHLWTPPKPNLNDSSGTLWGETIKAPF